jgi:hypothetical protein
MSNLISARRSKLVKYAIVVAAIAVGGVASAEAAAGGIPELLEKVLSLVTSIQSDVTAIKSDTAGATAAAQSTTRFTAQVIFRAGVLYCGEVNVASQPRSVLIQVINGSTQAVATQDSGSISTPPGGTRSVGIASSFATGSFYCKFTVLNGIGSDIRGNLMLGANLLNDTTQVSIAAE